MTTIVLALGLGCGVTAVWILVRYWRWRSRIDRDDISPQWLNENTYDQKHGDERWK